MSIPVRTRHHSSQNARKRLRRDTIKSVPLPLMRSIPQNSPAKKALFTKQVVEPAALDSIEITGLQKHDGDASHRRTRSNIKSTTGLKSKLALMALVLASPLKVGAQSLEEQWKTFDNNFQKRICAMEVFNRLGAPPEGVYHVSGFLPCMDVPNGAIEGFSEWPYGTSVMAVIGQQHNAFLQAGRACEANPYLKAVTSALKREDIPSLPAAHSAVKKWKNGFSQSIEPLSTFQFPFQKVNGSIIPNTSPNAWNKDSNPLGKHAIIVAVDETRPHCKGVAMDGLETMVDASAPFMPPNQKMILHN